MTKWTCLVIVVALAAVVVATPASAQIGPRVAADRAKSANNLKQLMLAVHAYHDAYQRLPGNITDKNGKVLLSWRVNLLPFLEQEALYKQFKLDEPWDSENNKKLIEKMPKVFLPLAGKADKGETFYQAFSGKGTWLEPGKNLALTGVQDGTSNTIAIVEAGDPVVWTKPVDLPFDADKPLPKLGGMFGGDFQAATLDGAVHRFGKTADMKELKKAITVAGGETIDFDALKK